MLVKSVDLIHGKKLGFYLFVNPFKKNPLYCEFEKLFLILQYQLIRNGNHF